MARKTIVVHEIATDGLPDMDDDDLVGRVAFIFDGCLVSGWPLHENYQSKASPTTWEANSDVGRHGRFYGVTHWVELPVPAFALVRP